MSNVMIPVIQYHRCDTCNNTHEYVVDQNFLKRCRYNVRVRCAVCGEERKQIKLEEKIYLDTRSYKPKPI